MIIIVEIIRCLITTTKFDSFSLLLKKLILFVIDVMKNLFSTTNFIIMFVVVNINRLNRLRMKFFVI